MLPSFFSYSTTYTGKEKGDGFSFYCSSSRIAQNWWYLLVKVTSQLSLGSVSTKQHFSRLLVLWLEGSKVIDIKYVLQMHTVFFSGRKFRYYINNSFKNLRTLKSILISDALKIVPNTVVKHYWGWYDF